MLVGICGKAGAGKDTIGDHLIDEYGFEKIAFADPIKRLVKDVLVLSDFQVYDRVEREKPLEQWGGRSVRECLQFVGTDLFRENFDKDVWVKSLWFRIADTDKNYVITDLRFPNEIDSLAEYGGDNFTSIKVLRDGYDGFVGVEKKINPIKRLFYNIIGKDTRHASECHDLDAEHDIGNNETIDHLNLKVDALMKSLKIEKVERVGTPESETEAETSLDSEVLYLTTDCSKRWEDSNGI